MYDVCGCQTGKATPESMTNGPAHSSTNVSFLFGFLLTFFARKMVVDLMELNIRKPIKNENNSENPVCVYIKKFNVYIKSSPYI